VAPHSSAPAHTLYGHLSERTARYLKSHGSLFTNETVTHILTAMRYKDATCDRNHRWTEGPYAFAALCAMKAHTARPVVGQATGMQVLSQGALIGV